MQRSQNFVTCAPQQARGATKCAVAASGGNTPTQDTATQSQHHPAYSHPQQEAEEEGRDVVKGVGGVADRHAGE
jgi:hypothetical protein